MAKVLKDSGGHIILELSRTSKKARCITILETVRDIREIPLEEKTLFGKGVDKITVTTYFDKVWKQVYLEDGVTPYPPKKAALKWLSNTLPLTDRAKREIIMILVLNDKMELVAKCADLATALEIGPSGGYAIASPEEMVAEHSGKDIGIIYKALTGQNPDLKQAKIKLAQKIFELAEKIQIDVKSPASPASRPKKAKKEKGEKKPMERTNAENGYRGKVRAFLTQDKEFTMEEVAEHLGCEVGFARTKVRLVAKDPGKYHEALEYVAVDAQPGKFKVTKEARLLDKLPEPAAEPAAE